MLLGMLFVIRNKQRLPELLLVGIGCLHLLYFLSVPWQIYRNVYTLPALFIYLSFRAFPLSLKGATSMGGWKRWGAKALALCVTGWFIFLVGEGVYRNDPLERIDQRVDFIQQASVAEQCKGNILIDINTQLHEDIFENHGVRYFDASKRAKWPFAQLKEEECVVVAGKYFSKKMLRDLTIVYRSERSQIEPPHPNLFFPPWKRIEIWLLKKREAAD
jgi:hypothetical protein